MALAEAGSESVPATSNSIYEVIANRRRRYVLLLLLDQNESVDIKALAKQIAALENDRPVEEVTYDQRKSVYVGLYQSHLPLLKDTGLIRAEQEWARIYLTDRGREVARQLREGSDKLHRYLLHASLVMVGVVIGVLIPLVLL